MKKFLFVLLPLIVSSCNYIGSTRVKNLIDLTPKLKIEKSTNLTFINAYSDPFKNSNKKNAYNISKHPIIGEPAILKGIIYSVDKEGYVHAFSLKDRKILWTTNIATLEFDRHFNSGGVLINGDKLYITYGSRHLVVLDLKTGYEIIRKEFPDILCSKPAMINEHVFVVQTISNQLIAYDVKDFKLIWMHEGGDETISSKSQVYPIIYDGYIIASYSSGDIVICLNAKDGSERWRYALSETGTASVPSFNPSVVVTTPIISERYAYFAISNNKILKINLSTGEIVWNRDASDIQSMSLNGNYLFVTNNARQVAAISAIDGKVVWTGNLISKKERSTKKPQPVYFQKPFVSKTANGIALNVIASNGELYQFEANNTITSDPIIRKIDKNVRYFWISCCSGKLHLITNYKIIF